MTTSPSNPGPAPFDPALEAPEHDLGDLATYAKVLVVEALVLIALFTFSRLFA